MNSSLEQQQQQQKLNKQRSDNLSKFASLIGVIIDSTKSGIAGGIISHHPTVINTGGNSSNNVGQQSNSFSSPGGGLSSIMNMNGKSSSSSSSPSLYDLSKFLHKDNKDHTGGALCSLPCMEIEAENDDSSTSSANSNGGGNQMRNSISGSNLITEILHNVGSSHDHLNSERTHPTPIPAMAASVWDLCQTNSNSNKSPSTSSTSNQTSDTANHEFPRPESKSPSSSSSCNTYQLEQIAAANLSKTTYWTRSSVNQAPGALIRSLASSFSSLLNSRVKAWTLLLLKHSLSNSNESSRNRLLSFLATRSTIDLNIIKTFFKPLEMVLPGKSQQQAAEGGDVDGKERKVKDGLLTTEDCDMIIPLNFEAVIDLSVQGQKTSVNLQTPGCIAAIFHENSSTMTFVEVKLNTEKLLQCMIEQARLVVFESVARATSFQVTNLSPSIPKNKYVGGMNSLGEGPSFALNTNQKNEQDTNPANVSTIKDAWKSLTFDNRNPNNTGYHSILKTHSSFSHNPNTSGNDLLKSAMNGNNTNQMNRNVTLSNIRPNPSPDSNVDQNDNTNHTTNDENNSKILILSASKKKLSVTWNHQIHDDSQSKSSCSSQNQQQDSQHYPSYELEPRKRRKLNYSTPLKRSMKSFGKPGADVFRSARNATFAEFGSLNRNSNGSNPLFTSLKLNNNSNSTMNQLGSRGGTSIRSEANFGLLRSNAGKTNISRLLASGTGGVNDTFSNANSNNGPTSSFADFARSVLNPRNFQNGSNGSTTQLPQQQGQKSSSTSNNSLINSMGLKRSPTQLENMLLAAQRK